MQIESRNGTVCDREVERVEYGRGFRLHCEIWIAEINAQSVLVWRIILLSSLATRQGIAEALQLVGMWNSLDCLENYLLRGE